MFQWEGPRNPLQVVQLSSMTARALIGWPKRLVARKSGRGTEPAYCVKAHRLRSSQCLAGLSASKPAIGDWHRWTRWWSAPPPFTRDFVWCL